MERCGAVPQYRIAEVDAGSRSLQLADPATLKLVKTVRLDDAYKSVPDLIYPGQLVHVDEENKTIVSGQDVLPGAVRIRQHGTGVYRLAIGVCREPEGGAALMATVPASATHTYVLCVDGCRPGGGLGKSGDDSGATWLRQSAERVTGLPIVLSPSVPCNGFLSDGRFLGAAFLEREVPQKVLSDCLRQGSLMPGAWMTGKCSVAPHALPSYNISESDLWFITPTPSPSECAFDVCVHGHFRWLAVNTWVIIELELTNKGLFRQAARGVTFFPH